MNMLFDIHFMQFQASKFIICFCIHASKDQILILKKNPQKPEDKRMFLQFFHLIAAFYFDPKGQLCLILSRFYGSNMLSLVERFETVKGDIPAL